MALALTNDELIEVVSMEETCPLCEGVGQDPVVRSEIQEIEVDEDQIVEEAIAKVVDVEKIVEVDEIQLVDDQVLNPDTGEVVILKKSVVMRVARIISIKQSVMDRIPKAIKVKVRRNQSVEIDDPCRMCNRGTFKRHRKIGRKNEFIVGHQLNPSTNMLHKTSFGIEDLGDEYRQVIKTHRAKTPSEIIAKLKEFIEEQRANLPPPPEV